MSRRVVLAAVASLGAVTLSAAGDRSIAAGFQRVWERISAASGASVAAASPAVFPAIAVTNSANLPVLLAAPDPDDDSAMLGWSDKGGLLDPSHIKGLAYVNTEGAGMLAVMNTQGTSAFGICGNHGYTTLANSADVAEAFAVPSGPVPPGAVLVLDPDNPGTLRLATQPYDHRVAGVAAGAHGVNPGITLRGHASLENKTSLTLSGTAYALATAANGSIHVGDLLTTSSVPGHAMKATDAVASQGAILGKAMQDLKGDAGAILILASLQ
jgi:hypothetical protein